MTLACCSLAHAELAIFDIDPLRSQVQLAGTVSGSAFQEQSAGSLSNAMTGTILVDLTDSQIKFTGGSAGKLVATRRAGPVTPPEISVARPADPVVPLTLSWPDGYKLQRSTTLSPANWQDSPASSPLQIPLRVPGEYFRIVTR